MSRRRLPFVVVLTLLVAAVASGCSQTVDGEDLGHRIGQAISQEQGGRKVDVVCPDGVEDTKGTTFACAMTVGAGTASQRVKVNVTLLGDSRFSYTVVAA